LHITERLTFNAQQVNLDDQKETIFPELILCLRANLFNRGLSVI